MDKINKTCRTKKCLHENRIIDITKDNFVKIGKSYYHEDCYQLKTKDKPKIKKLEKSEKPKKNIKTNQKKSAKNEKKCRCTNCLHDSRIIDIESDEYIVKGNAYYHKDCKEVSDNIRKIIEFWHDNIDGAVVYVQLTKILKKLIYDDHVSSEYLLFAIKYAKQNEIIFNLRHPPGIRWVAQNPKVKDAYGFYRMKKKQENKTETNNITPSAENLPNEKMCEPKEEMYDFGFGRIFGNKK